MSVRQKFLLPMLTVIIMSSGLLAYISYEKSKSSLTDALFDNIQQRVSASAFTLQSWIKDRIIDVNSWSNEELYARSVQDNFLGKASRVTANARMAQLKADYGYYETISLSDTAGMIIASSDKDQPGNTNVADRDFFKTAVSGDVAISNVLVHPKTGNVVFFIGTPIFEKEKIGGVLICEVNVSGYSEKNIDSIKIGKTGFAYLLDQTGMVLAHRDKSQIMKTDIKEYDFGRQIMRNKNGLIEYTYNGDDRLACFKTLDNPAWIIIITIDKNEVLSSAKSLGRINLAVSLIVVIAVAIIIFFLVTSVVKPLNNVVLGLKDAAEGEGDLTKRITVASKDEVGELAYWFNVFIGKIQQIIREVSENAVSLTHSSKQLADISAQQSRAVSQTSDKAMAVASASEEMSMSINSIAKVMDETNQNLSMVASGAEEVTATISEVARNAEKGRQIADRSVSQTEQAKRQVGELGRAAQKIEKVVETITEISEQVNLLALNATIESARAGEAGKGFAVVANEIKELARQTAQATQEIKEHVGGIQQSVQGTVTEITAIADVVSEVNDVVSAIAAAVEEQSITTKSIASNVAQASASVAEVNRSISETAKVATSITSDISEVTHASEEISESGVLVDNNSRKLAQLADILSSLVGQFKV